MALLVLLRHGESEWNSQNRFAGWADPDLLRYPVVLVVAHRNSLRALKKHLDGLSDEEIVSLNVPTGIPLCHELDDATVRPARQASYLDPQGAAAGIEAVANQGRQ